MTLADFETQGLLHKAQVDKEHILDLLEEAENDLVDARRDVSLEWSFNVACSSVVNLCHALLHSSGYKAGSDIKLKSIKTLSAVLSADRKSDIDYLLACLDLRERSVNVENIISHQNVSHLIRFTEDFYLEVIDNLRGSNPLLFADKDVSFLEKSEEGFNL